jgi:hypothetical protein
MAGTQSNTSQECPLLSTEPVVILDKISIREQRIEGEQRNGVQVGVPGQGSVERCPCDFRGVDYNFPVNYLLMNR